MSLDRAKRERTAALLLEHYKRGWLSGTKRTPIEPCANLGRNETDAYKSGYLEGQQAFEDAIHREATRLWETL